MIKSFADSIVNMNRVAILATLHPAGTFSAGPRWPDKTLLYLPPGSSCYFCRDNIPGFISTHILDKLWSWKFQWLTGIAFHTDCVSHCVDCFRGPFGARLLASLWVGCVTPGSFPVGSAATRGLAFGATEEGDISLMVWIWKSLYFHQVVWSHLLWSNNPSLLMHLEQCVRQLCYEGNVIGSRASPTQSCSHRPSQLSKYLPSMPDPGKSMLTTLCVLFTLEKKTIHSI